MIFDSIEITTNTVLFINILIAFLAIGYSYFVYQITIPQISKSIKYILISLRSIALILSILLIFEPIVNIRYLENDTPLNLLLVDNSTSIVAKDSSQISEANNFVSRFREEYSDNYMIATFGNSVKLLEDDKTLDFTETTTNFDKIVPFVQNLGKKFASITILSDGIITEGSNSTLEFEKMGIPIFTIPMGDSTKPADISIKSVEYNKLIYVNSETEINCTILNNNFENKNVTVTLFSREGIVGERRIKLNNNGINNVIFGYTPKIIGKQYLTVKVSNIENEDNSANNKYDIAIDALNNKTNILLVAGAPSKDLSALVETMKANKDVSLSTIIQTGINRFLDNLDYLPKINNADIIFMIDFPSKHTPQSLLKAVSNRIKVKKKPYFLFISESTDFSKLNQILDKYNKNIPKTKTIYKTKVDFVDGGKGIIKDITSGQNLPPIKTRGDFDIPNVLGKDVLAFSILTNQNTKKPLILISKFTTPKSIIFNGFEFWRWKITSESENEDFIPSFLGNSIKWLTIKKDKKVFVETNKNIYNLSDNIEFIGNVYDATLTPINDASIDVTISNDEYEKSIPLELTNNGIYKGSISLNRPGIYKYHAKIISDKTGSANTSGDFLISDNKVENNSFVLNSNYLKFISNITNGKTFNLDMRSELFSEINHLSIQKSRHKFIVFKYEIWNNKWFLMFIIILFSLEWFIRKQKGML